MFENQIFYIKQNPYTLTFEMRTFAAWIRIRDSTEIWWKLRFGR